MEWREFPNNPKYLVSDQGDIKNSKIGKVLKPWIDHTGYKIIRLGLKGKNLSIHRIVAITYIPNKDPTLQVNHKDGNKLNNNVENLEWCTRNYNSKHAYDLGLNTKRFRHKDSIGSKNGMSKIDENKVKEIRKIYESGNYSYNDIAKLFNVCCHTIGYIVRKQTWKHV